MIFEICAADSSGLPELDLPRWMWGTLPLTRYHDQLQGNVGQLQMSTSISIVLAAEADLLIQIGRIDEDRQRKWNGRMDSPSASARSVLPMRTCSSASLPLTQQDYYWISPHFHTSYRVYELLVEACLETRHILKILSLTHSVFGGACCTRDKAAFASRAALLLTIPRFATVVPYYSLLSSFKATCWTRRGGCLQCRAPG